MNGRSGGQCTVTWLPNFLEWVVYHIFLPMVLCRRASRLRAPLLKSLDYIKQFHLISARGNTSCKARHTIFPMRLKHDAHSVFLPMYFCFMAVLLVKYKGCMPQKYCKFPTLPIASELECVISVFQLILPECMKLLPLYTNCILKNDILLGGECTDVSCLLSNQFY